MSRLVGLFGLLAFCIAVDCETIRFRISARHLPDMDRRRTIDPYVRVFYRRMTRGTAREMSLGRTRYILDNESPSWDKTFLFNYNPGAQQILHFKLYDRDLVRDDYVDSGYLNMDVFVQQGQYAVIPLKQGQLYICGY